jgi:hypothetical protein
MELEAALLQVLGQPVSGEHLTDAHLLLEPAKIQGLPISAHAGDTFQGSMLCEVLHLVVKILGLSSTAPPLCRSYNTSEALERVECLAEALVVDGK